jgi:outer membrane protein TolC
MEKTMMHKRSLLLSLALLFTAKLCQAQETTPLGLPDIIALAQSQSPQYYLQKTQKELSGYAWQSYKSDLKPQISLYGQAPVYSKAYVSVVQPDGTISFQPVKQNYSDVGLSLSQLLPFTGGTVSLNTDLNRFDDLKTKFRQYNGTPLFIALNQPLFAFNEQKWKPAIESQRLEEAGRTFVLQMESIAQQSVGYFFDVVDAETNIGIATDNLTNSTANFEIEQKRTDLGTTTEDKVLQLQLQMLKSRQDLEKANYDHKIASLNLRTFIGIKNTREFHFILPEDLPEFEIGLDSAIAYTRQYRPEYIAFERRKNEARRDVAQARAASHQINLYASYGLNRAANDLSTVYGELKSQQTFSLGFNLPIVDWGRRRARYNTATATERLVKLNNDLEEASIEQEVTTLVNNIELLRANITLAATTDSVARRRYAIANGLFRTGKLTITELNLAQGEKDNARRSYISSLRSYWSAYYLVRKLTLFDFVRKEPLIK